MIKEYKVYVIERRGRYIEVEAPFAEAAVEQAIEEAQYDRRTRQNVEWEHIEFEDVSDDNIQVVAS